MPCSSSTVKRGALDGFLKQGEASCGIARRYTGSAGKIADRRIGVFAASASPHGHALSDRRLYPPTDRGADPERRAAARVPDRITFATEPAIAVRMVERAIAAGAPFARVAADSVCGVGEIERALRRAGKGYVLGVTGSHRVWSWGAKPAVSGTADEVLGKYVVRSRMMALSAVRKREAHRRARSTAGGGTGPDRPAPAPRPGEDPKWRGEGIPNSAAEGI